MVREWDVFISHASEDKKRYVEPLAKRLKELDIKVWFDKFSLKPGDSLSEKIGEGLAKSRHGVVVFSPSFFKKNWSRHELNGLRNRMIEESDFLIIPIWLDIKRDAIAKKDPSLADIFAIKGEKNNIDSNVSEIIKIVKPQIFKNIQDLLRLGISSFKMGRIPLNQIKGGPIRHEKLSEHLRIRAENIWHEIKDVYETSLERFMTNLKRDLLPQREIEVWERILLTLKKTTGMAGYEDTNKKEIFKVILNCSFGDFDESVKEMEKGEIRPVAVYLAGKAWLETTG